MIISVVSLTGFRLSNYTTCTTITFTWFNNGVLTVIPFWDPAFLLISPYNLETLDIRSPCCVIFYIYIPSC